MERTPPQIEITADGSQTLRHPLSGDTYHSMRGAVGESEHVFIRNGLLWLIGERKTGSEENMAAVAGGGYFHILEVGFGSGLNAWLTARATPTGVSVYYEALELYPVAEEVIGGLAYAGDSLFRVLHEASWERPAEISESFTLKKRCVSLIDCRFDTTFDLIYFDAFAPDTQPEMWAGAVFRRLFAALAPGGALVTYSAKGVVKENLRAAGFDVHRLPGALGKRHMLRAKKPIER